MKHEKSFLNAVLRDLGNAPDHLIKPNEMHRFPTKDKGGDDAGWCVYYDHGDFAGGAYGDWRTGLSVKWNSANCTPEIKKRITQQHYSSQAKASQMANKAARDRLAKTRFAPLRPIDYVTKKQIDINDEYIKAVAGCHKTEDRLLIFMHNKDGVRQSVQTIHPDSKKKKFMSGVGTKELYTTLGPVTPTIYIAEGFATSCAIYQATKQMTVCAFMASNLPAVTKIIAEQCPAATIVIAADNDQAGEDAARKAVQFASNLQCLPPDVGQDWNDYYVEHGPEATKAAMESQVSEVASLSAGKPEPEEKSTPSEGSNPISLRRAQIKPIFLEPRPVEWSRVGLPEVIADTAEASSRVTGSSPILFSSPAIAVACAAINDKTRVSLKKNENFTQRACVWCTTVASSGAGKSPMANKALAPLREIETELAPQIAKTYEEYKIAMKVRANAIKDIERGEDIETPPLIDRQQYEMPRLIFQDCTTESVTKNQSFWSGGSVIVADELSALIGGFDRYSNGNRDEGFMLQAYDGGSYVVDRKLEGVTRIENLSLGIISGIQPVVAARLFTSTGSNGFIERHLLSIAGSRVDQDEDASDITELDRWREAITLCYERGNEGRQLHLSSGADKVRRNLNAWVTRHAKSDFEGLNSHLNKFAALFGRLVIPWHFLSDAGFDRDTEVSEETAQLLYDYLTKNYYQHALSAYTFFAEARNYNPELIALVRALQKHESEKITHSELRSVMPMPKSRLSDAISFLESRNYLIKDSLNEWAVIKT